MGDTMLNADGIKALAELPSLDELRARIIGLIQAPATKIARDDQRARRPAGPRHRRLCGQGSGVTKSDFVLN